MDPVQLMVPSIGRVSSERCHNDAQCVDGEADFRSMCLTLEPSETLMRIVIREPPWTATPGGTRVVLWSGPREEIWEQGAPVPDVVRWPDHYLVLSHNDKTSAKVGLDAT
jgi:hypothetical protein